MRDSRDVEPPAVEPRAPFPLRREELVSQGIVNNTRDERSIAIRGKPWGRCSRPREMQKKGNPWAKFVVPSRGSTYQRYS